MYWAGKSLKHVLFSKYGAVQSVARSKYADFGLYGHDVAYYAIKKQYSTK